MNDGNLLYSQSRLNKAHLLERLGNLRVPVEVMSGKSSPSNYRKYLLVVVGVFVTLCIYAQLSFPENYSIFTNTISDQGSRILNPTGSRLWNFGVILLGIFVIPYFLHIYHLLKSLSEIIALLSTGIGIMSSISLSFVGIYPLDIRLPHLISASVAFIGIFLKANLDLVLLLIKNRKKSPQHKVERQTNFIKIGIFYTIFDGAFAMMMITYLTNGSIVAFWEWLYFFAIILWIFGIAKVST